MTGQECIHNNYSSNLESSIVLQKHKAAVQQSEKKPPHPGFPHPELSPQIYLPANKRRYALNHFSGRLMATGYLGTDIAIEYLLGKYRTYQSVHTIRHAGGNILLFLSFLDEIGANILTLSPQNINDWIEYDQDRGLKVNSVDQRASLTPFSTRVRTLSPSATATFFSKKYATIVCYKNSNDKVSCFKRSSLDAERG